MAFFDKLRGRFRRKPAEEPAPADPQTPSAEEIALQEELAAALQADMEAGDPAFLLSLQSGPTVENDGAPPEDGIDENGTEFVTLEDFEMQTMESAGMVGEVDPQVSDMIVQEYEEYENRNEAVEDALGDVDQVNRAALDTMMAKLNAAVGKDETKRKMREADSVGKDIDDEIMRLKTIDDSAEAKIQEKKRQAEEARLAMEAQQYLDDVNGHGDPHRQHVFVETADEAEADGGAPSEPRKRFIALRLIDSFAGRFPMRLLQGVAGGLLLVFIGVTVALIVITVKKNNVEKYEYTLAEAPAAAPNSAKFVFLNLVADLDGEPLTLQKMVYDSLSTVFYFDRYFDAEAHNVSLVDDLGNYYGLDQSFAPYTSPSGGGQTVVRFPPFDQNASGFEMLVDGQSDEGAKALYALGLERREAPLPARYAVADAELPESFADMGVRVNLARFSASGSELYFSFDWKEGGDALYFADRSQVDAHTSQYTSAIAMEQAGTVLPTKPQPNMYAFPEARAIIGRMDFAALRNLDGRTKVTFRDVFRRIPLNETLTAEKLYASKEDAGVRLHAGPYDVCFERLFFQRDKFILVMHTEDRAVPFEGDESNAAPDRVEAFVDVSLAFTGASGETVQLLGKPKYRRAGADIAFDATGFINELVGVYPSDLRLEVHSASIHAGSVSVTLEPLEDYAEGYAANEAFKNLSTHVEAAFRSRLSYKSGEIGREWITGFAPSAMPDPSFSDHYAPSPNTHNVAYSAKLITFAQDPRSENMFLAAVRESWRATVDGRPARMSLTHKIVGMTTENGVRILTDELAIE